MYEEEPKRVCRKDQPPDARMGVGLVLEVGLALGVGLDLDVTLELPEAIKTK